MSEAIQPAPPTDLGGRRPIQPPPSFDPAYAGNNVGFDQQAQQGAPSAGGVARICHILCCEAGWQAKQLEKCCCCISPIRKGALCASVFSALASIVLELFFDGALVPSWRENQLLRLFYLVHCIFWALVFVASTVTFVAIKLDVLRSASLVLSKLLRCGFWLCLLTFFAIGFSTVRARPGWLSALSVSHSKSVLYGAFVWSCRALTRQKWRFPARAGQRLS
jgi:hypothetical protein